MLACQPALEAAVLLDGKHSRTISAGGLPHPIKKLHTPQAKVERRNLASFFAEPTCPARACFIEPYLIGHVSRRLLVEDGKERFR